MVLEALVLVFELLPMMHRKDFRAEAHSERLVKIGVHAPAP